MTDRKKRIEALNSAVAERILVLDGAMGTMIQGYELDEAGYRGKRFAGLKQEVRGNNDLLNLSQPKIIGEIYGTYLDAGADIIATNTFNSNEPSQSDYSLEELVPELNREGARLAREAADAATKRDPSRPRWVAGAIGPTTRTASISPDVNNPGFRNTSFEALREAYGIAARGLVEGGVDVILVETIFDTLNAKAALYAVEELFDETGERLPIMVSCTVTDLSGRNLSGQTPEAFWNSIRHVRPFSVGLNCAFGAEQLRPYVAELARIADTNVCAYPNAGLPNEFGEYDEQPETTSGFLREWAESGLVNILGGCCGTTPAHIAAISKAVEGLPPREIPSLPTRLRLSGLEPFELSA